MSTKKAARRWKNRTLAFTVCKLGSISTAFLFWCASLPEKNGWTSEQLAVSVTQFKNLNLCALRCHRKWNRSPFRAKIHPPSTRTAVRSVCLFAKISIKWMAYKPLMLCSFEENDSRRRTKLNGKVSDLRNRICGILDIPLSSLNVESSICSNSCFRSLKRFEKFQEDAKTLHACWRKILWGISVCAFGLGNFSKCCSTNKISSPQRKSKKVQVGKKFVIWRNLT